MWTISWLQLKHSWRQWLATIPVFVTVGLILGFCLTGIVNVAESQQVDLYGQNTPLPIFIMPIVFGGITMLIVIKGIVNQLLDQFKADYRMLAILGATVNALAAILGIQIGIVSGVSALLGGVIALPLTRFCYVWLQQIVGPQMLPNMSIHFSFMALLLTVILASLIAGSGGFWHARHQLKDGNKHPSHRRRIVCRIKMIVLLMVVIGLIIKLAMQIMTLTYVGQSEKVIVGLGNSVGNLNLVLFLLLILITFTGQTVLKLASRGLYWLGARTLFLNLAAHDIDYAVKKYLPLYTPVTIIAVLITGMSAIMWNIPAYTNTTSANNERLVNFILTIGLYLGAPLLIVLANVLATMLVAKEDNDQQMRQLQLLGLTQQQLLLTQQLNVVILVGVSLVASLLAGGLVWGLTIHVGRTILHQAPISMSALLAGPFLMASSMFCLLTIVNVFRVYHGNWLTKE